MHQPYYRSARTGAFQMPWARLHALKDYLDMVEILAGYPTIHQTFNLVPSLVEQLEDYARRAAVAADVYWEHTIKPAADLSPSERAFIVERMCERPDHPRAKSHPRYLELARKREAEACRGWDACGAVVHASTNSATFRSGSTSPGSTRLCSKHRASAQPGRSAAETTGRRTSWSWPRLQKRYPGAGSSPRTGRPRLAGQIELSTSPYFHPILPLLANTDSARVGAGDTILPHRRFAHPEDAWEQVDRGRGQARAGLRSAAARDVVLRAGGRRRRAAAADEGRHPVDHQRPDGPVPLRRPGATGGAAERPGRAGRDPASPYPPYLLRREEGEMAIVFRDHTLSDLIGFGYQSWDSRDAANDLLGRIRAIGASQPRRAGERASRHPVAAARRPPLVTIALDGENAWEYYPHDGRDFLHYLYEGLAADPGIRCVTVSEYLREYPATAPLDWLHTGSWIGGDLRTWSGDPGHNAAWDLLHDARDLAAAGAGQ